MKNHAIVLWMSAESGLIVQQDSVSPRAELAAVLAAFEKATDMQACFRPMSDRWQDTEGHSLLVEPFAGHRSAFCEAAKARSMAACTKCDLTDLPADCSPLGHRITEPFVRTCHAAADEVLLPLWSDGVLVAVLFIGQFRRRPPNGDGRRSAALPYVDDEALRSLLSLTLPLRSYLLDLLRMLDEQRHRPAAGRRGVIESYIRESLSGGPTLQGLATRLSLSRSRAGHLVHELTGRSFSELVEQRRITIAKDLLTSSEGTVAWISRQAGLRDTAYFCRYFKDKTGLTPTQFREQRRQDRTV